MSIRSGSLARIDADTGIGGAGGGGKKDWPVWAISLHSLSNNLDSFAPAFRSAQIPMSRPTWLAREVSQVDASRLAMGKAVAW